MRKLIAGNWKMNGPLAALDEGRAAIDDARLRRIEDELAALKARVAAMQPEPTPPDGEQA